VRARHVNRRRRYRSALPARSKRRSRTEQAARLTRSGQGLRFTPVAASLVALLALVSVLVLVVAYSPRLAARLPFVGWALGFAADHLPANVAWLYDEGNAMLRPGAYFGWSDGARGELHIYGAGCGAEGAAGGQITYFALAGPAGRLEFSPSAVTHLWTDLDRAQAHPHLRVEVITDRTLHFDRAILRCRDGSEATARILATTVHVPAEALAWPESLRPLAVDPLLQLAEQVAPGAAPRAVVHGPTSLPGVGQTAELTLLPADVPLTLHGVRYAPGNLATGAVVAAAGHREALPYWRQAATAPYAPTPTRQSLPPLTPWDAAYQAATHAGALRTREADAAGLLVAPGEVGVLFLLPDAFRPTPTPRPMLLTPVLELELAGHRGAVVAAGLAFGWTPAP